mgnify:CR=1 FL=1
MELHQNIYFIDVPLLYDHILNNIFKKLKILPSWFFHLIFLLPIFSIIKIFKEKHYSFYGSYYLFTYKIFYAFYFL